MEPTLDQLRKFADQAREMYEEARRISAVSFASSISWEYWDHQIPPDGVDVVWFKHAEPLTDPVGWADELHMAGWHSDVDLDPFGISTLQFDDGRWTLAIFPNFISEECPILPFLEKEGIVIHDLDKALAPWEK